MSIFSDVIGLTPEDVAEQPIDELPPELPPEIESPSIVERVRSWVPTDLGPKTLRCPDHPDAGPYNERGLKIHVARNHPKGETPPAPPKPRAPKERKPQAPREISPKRQSGEDIFATAVSAGATMLVNFGISPPAGMALALEAGALAPELDKAVAGTVVDRVAVQPLVKAKGRWSTVASLAAFPVLVFMIDKQPEMMPVLYPALRGSVKQMLPSLVAQKKRQVEDETKMNEAAAQLLELQSEIETLQSKREADPIDMLLASLFPPPTEPEAPPEPGSAWQPE